MRRSIQITLMFVILAAIATLFRNIVTYEIEKSNDSHSDATMTAAAVEFHKQLTVIRATESMFNELEDSKLELVADFQDTMQASEADRSDAIMNALQTAWAGTQSSIERMHSTPIP